MPLHAPLPVALLAAALASHPPAASPPPPRLPVGFLNAGDLRERCLSNAAATVSYCFAYIAGVNDAVKAYEAWLGQREYCAPAEASQGDLRQAFLSYLAQNPEIAAGEAASVVVVALKQKYPCAKAPGSP